MIHSLRRHIGKVCYKCNIFRKLLHGLALRILRIRLVSQDNSPSAGLDTHLVQDVMTWDV